MDFQVSIVTSTGIRVLDGGYLGCALPYSNSLVEPLCHGKGGAAVPYLIASAAPLNRCTQASHHPAHRQAWIKSPKSAGCESGKAPPCSLPASGESRV